MPSLTASEIAAAHAIDDRETLRTRALRAAIDADAYLATAAAANTAGDHTVAGEYIERATRRLESAIEALRNLR